MKISILILTHKRPELFNRCLQSVLNNLPEDVEIIVNNDSNDIVEIKNNQVKYFYQKNNNLPLIYNFLIEQSVGKYLYFLEDDDFVVPNFWKIISTKLDGNNTLFYNYIPENNYKEYINIFYKKIPNGIYHKLDFFNIMNIKKFQLSQIIFRKEDVVFFPTNNDLDYDFKLLTNLNNLNIEFCNDPLFIQTTDGKDNISFKEFCTDLRFIEQAT